jgi:hypothetical protein
MHAEVLRTSDGWDCPILCETKPITEFDGDVAAKTCRPGATTTPAIAACGSFPSRNWTGDFNTI